MRTTRKQNGRNAGYTDKNQGCGIEGVPRCVIHKRRNLLTFEGAVHQARLAVEQGRIPRYAHVLVDEAQDFSLEALQLIRALSRCERYVAATRAREALLITVAETGKNVESKDSQMSPQKEDILDREEEMA